MMNTFSKGRDHSAGELSVSEMDEAVGGMKFSLGGIHVMFGESDIGVSFGVSISGVGGFAITVGGICGQLGNPKAGGVGGCI